MEQKHDFTEDLAEWVRTHRDKPEITDLLPNGDTDLIPADGVYDLATIGGEELLSFTRKDRKGKKKTTAGKVSMRFRAGRNLARASMRFPAQMTRDEHREMAQ